MSDQQPDAIERFSHLPVRRLSPGEVLLSPDDALGPMYVLKQGDLEIRAQGKALSHVRQPGSFVGEMSVLMGRSPTAEVVATSAAEVIVFENAREVLEADASLAVEVATLLARRLAAMTTYLVDLREQYAGTDGHLGLMDAVLAALVHHVGPLGPSGSEREDQPPV